MNAFSMHNVLIAAKKVSYLAVNAMWMLTWMVADRSELDTRKLMEATNVLRLRRRHPTSVHLLSVVDRPKTVISGGVECICNDMK